MKQKLSAKEAESMLLHALEIGKQMLSAGAEVQRVEDSIYRICTAYGSEKTEVLCLTYTIITTISSEDWGTITHSVRVHSFSRNLYELIHLNDLSRRMCQCLPDMKTVDTMMEKISSLPKYSICQSMLTYAIISASFTIFFGGNIRDTFASALVGAGICYVESLFMTLPLNRFLLLILLSISAGAMSVLSVWAGLGTSVDHISIGNIMILIPGLLFTNCIQEMISDNMLSGISRLCETLFVSVSIAIGFAIAHYLL